tara:strand:- start:83 stop:1930 length:1848 start_codon:yes stop_codon:yes gene_type:complete
MRLIFYLFVFAQLLNYFHAFAEELKRETIQSNSIKWEKIEENKSNNLKNIIWKSFNDDDKYFEKKIIEKNPEKIFIDNQKKKIKLTNKNANQEFLQAQPHIPLNNFLNEGAYVLSTYWVSSFSGGAAGGTGNQNYAFKFDYGLSNDSLISIYASETDDPLYKLIDGEKIPNNWVNVALGYKKKLLKSDHFKTSLSFAGFLEYWVFSSGYDDIDDVGSKKSIYNEIDNTNGHERYEKFIYSFSFPFTKELNSKANFSIVPGITLIPEIIGNKNIGKNFYGNNYFLASSLNFDVGNNLQLIGSYTYLFGPGHNSFDESLKFYRNTIYSYGFNWKANTIIGFEAKITNGYGNTPSTSLLTIPSDNKPLYYLGANYHYQSFGVDTRFVPLNKNNDLLLFGGLSVDNALIPERGISQINFNFDDKGNLFAFYGYSLSNIFQVEIRSGSFNDVNLVNNKDFKLQNTYLSNDIFNYRLGGKLLIFSPQKDDLFWMTLRTSLGRNQGSNHQGYMFTELINTFRVNEWLALNISPKYFFSGVRSFGGLGISGYINLLDNLQLIPEINTAFKNKTNLNSTLALRYSYSPQSSVDLYYSNAAGIQDIGQLLENNENRFGIKLNFLY